MESKKYILRRVTIEGEEHVALPLECFLSLFELAGGNPEEVLNNKKHFVYEATNEASRTY